MPLFSDVDMSKSQSLSTSTTAPRHSSIGALTTTSPIAATMSNTSKSELLVNMQKFTAQINSTIQQANGDVRLHIPSFSPQMIDSATQDPLQQEKLETLARQWCEIVSSILLKELKRQPLGSGPLAEIEFWRDRNVTLSTLHEQLRHNTIQHISRVLTSLNSSVCPTLNTCIADVSKYFLEADDNVKFLNTLERHLKGLSFAPLAMITESLPSLMNAIRMVFYLFSAI